MRYFQIYSNACCTYKTNWTANEYEIVELAREQNQDTPLEVFAGIPWDDEAGEWERELSHAEALETALRVNFFGDYLVTEI